tara:strand:- start:3555 stop:4364 length:810 start_codon:yes stop_codon:yes gene_type:complete
MSKKVGPKIDTALKHKLYEASVQNFEVDVDFINVEYEKNFGNAPLTLREDFGGTGALACHWTTVGEEHKAYAIDLDPEPMKYGVENHRSKLTPAQQKRVEYVEGNVLASHSFKTDVVVAFNFSYFIFKDRSQLVKYFKGVYDSLENRGAFFVDIFGGTECGEELVEETEHDDHTYFWDCDKFNPLTNECLYYIHFKTHDDGVKYERVFTYDWRHWSPREVVEAMEEAGFSTVKTYWEGDDGDGGGDGEFYESTSEENCESWVTYIAAFK